MLAQLYPLALLTVANVFMTFAWYGHLKSMKDSPLWIVIMVSWGIAFAEYCFQVPANRIGSQYFTLPQLKILQEVITLLVFAVFSIYYMKEPFKMDFVWAGCCLLGAVYFIFRS